MPLGKDHQRALGRFDDFDRGLHRLLVHAFAIDRERAGPPQQERLQFIAHEQVGAGHDEKRPADASRQAVEDERVFIAAMVGREQDAMPGIDRSAKFFGSDDLHAQSFRRRGAV